MVVERNPAVAAVSARKDDLKEATYLPPDLQKSEQQERSEGCGSGKKLPSLAYVRPKSSELIGWSAFRRLEDLEGQESGYNLGANNHNRTGAKRLGPPHHERPSSVPGKRKEAGWCEHGQGQRSQREGKRERR